jgi:hypothetical protein
MGPRSRLRPFPILLVLLSVLASGCTTHSRSYGRHERYGPYDEYYEYPEPGVRCDGYGRCWRYQPHRGGWAPHQRPGVVYVPVYRDDDDRDHDHHHHKHRRDRDDDDDRDRDERRRREAEERRREEERRVESQQPDGRGEWRRKDRYEGRMQKAQTQEQLEDEEAEARD